MNMKIIKHTLVAALALLGLLAGEAFAQATSANVTVSAVVPKACRFYSSPNPMTIEHSGGLIDPVSGSNATGSSTLNYRCTNTVSPRFDIDTSGTFASPKSATVLLAGALVPANTVAADITVTATGGAGTGLGAGQNKTATIGGVITPANFSGAAPDTYSKTVTIAIEAIP
ncbi:MAG: hypothetical protein ACT4PQ_10355 [Betaproteobacteria bacterium]